ncbi:hypothetical protein BJ170DRAFT_688340 [Xylariales sp. AK1849]|nr:hypothetical protein BJ170DRAFT_688340 [Xylariales sp. AK1849]
MVQDVSEVWIVLYALDECQTRKEHLIGGLLSWIEHFQDLQSGVHLLVTSRPEQDIKSTIEGPARSKDIISIQSDLVQKALTNLPKTLDETYARILINIPKEYKHHTTRILQFLVFSERPLGLDEALGAIVVDTTTRPRFDPKYRMPVPEGVLKYSPSLVIVTQGMMQLAHFSVKEYLTSDRLEQDMAKDFEKTVARTSVANICLAYLLDLDHNLPTEKITQSFPLAQYSAQYWTSHAAVTEDPSDTVHMNDHRDYKLQDISPAMYYASLNGLVYPVRKLIEKEADINYGGGNHRSSRGRFNMRTRLDSPDTPRKQGRRYLPNQMRDCSPGCFAIREGDLDAFR